MRTTNLLTVQRTLSIFTILALLIMIIPSVTTAAPPKDNSLVYYVQYGDTLFSISRRFGTTVPALMTANGLTSYYIYAGQRLTIPLNPVPGPTPVNFGCKYSVQPKDTIYSIAYRYGVPWYNLLQANYLYSPLIFVGQQLNVPCVNPTPTPFPMYTVKSGDNLFRLAIQYGTSIYAIALVNGIPNPNYIFVGENLTIPYPNTVKYPVVPTVTPTVAGATTVAPTVTPGGPTVTPTTAGTTSAVVVMQNLTFLPNTVTINVGGAVLWKNTDSVTHTVTSGVPGTPSGLFDSGQLAPNQTFSFTFNSAGTFPYFSSTDGSQMTGSVTVQ